MAKRKTRPKTKPAKTFKERRLSVRITEEMHEKIETARKGSGRTYSGEVEHQLNRALFDWGTGPTHAVMTAIGKAVDNLAKMRLSPTGGWSKDDEALWWRDPYLFSQTAQAMTAALDIYRPQGEPPQEQEELLDLGGPHQGRFAIEGILRDIQLVDPSTPPAQQSARTVEYWRWLCGLKEDLGFLADNPTIRGRTARQAQFLRDRSAKFRDELIALSREAGRMPEGMSLEEYQNASRKEIEPRNLPPKKLERLAELRRRIAQLRKESE